MDSVGSGVSVVAGVFANGAEFETVSEFDWIPRVGLPIGRSSGEAKVGLSMAAQARIAFVVTAFWWRSISDAGIAGGSWFLARGDGRRQVGSPACRC